MVRSLYPSTTKPPTILMTLKGFKTLSAICWMRYVTKKSFSAILLISLLLLPISALSTTERISLHSMGNQSNGISNSPALSDNGRYVTFDSIADNLVNGDTNTSSDIFVHDRTKNTTERVSIHSSTNEGNGDSQSPDISADGRYITFESIANNLVGDDTNESSDIFVHDRETGMTERISIDSSGNEGNGNSKFPSISADGRYIAFESIANNLVGDDTNESSDIFVHDRQTDTTKRVSIDSAGTEGLSHSFVPSINSDGRYVVFQSIANNLVSDDTNFAYDIFIHDIKMGKTERVSVNAARAEGNSHSFFPHISADGRFTAFSSYANNLVDNDTNPFFDVFVHDRLTKTTTLVHINSSGEQGNNDSYLPQLSADGRYVTFYSNSNNLVDDDTNSVLDIFVHDRQTGETLRISTDSMLEEGNDNSFLPSISADGRTIAFNSSANNLVNDDTNGSDDIFVFSPNNAPEFQLGQDQTVCKNPGTISTDNWVNYVSDGDSGSQYTWFTVIRNSHPDLFGGLLNFGGQPIIDNTSKKLSFRPALNAHGKANICAQLHDNGGTALGGQNTSAVRCFNITVDPSCDDGAGELFNPGQFDLSTNISGDLPLDGLDNIGNIPLNGSTSGIDQAADFSATIINHGNPVNNVTANLQITGYGEIISADDRCSGNPKTGQYQCNFDNLPSGETTLNFKVKNSRNVDATLEVKPRNAVAGDSVQNESSNGGGSFGWITLLFLLRLRYKSR